MSASLPPPDDAGFLDRLRQGDEGAFESIFRAWYPDLVRYAFSIVRNQDVAEDIAQEVMLELWRRREMLMPDTRPRAYLLRATRNRSLNHLRHSKVRSEHASEFEDRPLASPGSDEHALTNEIEAAIQQAIASLTPRCREVFDLSRERGLKYHEIADVLGISVKAVEANMGRALRVMRERLAHWLPPGRTL